MFNCLAFLRRQATQRTDYFLGKYKAKNNTTKTTKQLKQLN
jgi:hypothetical protein